MDFQLEKFLCNFGNNNESIFIKDFIKFFFLVKMMILKCMIDFDDISDSDLFSSSREEVSFNVFSYRLVICGDSDEEKMDSDCVDGKFVKQLIDRLIIV